MQSYDMKHAPRGHATLINNLSFESMPERVGSEVDAEKLHSLLTSHCFMVTEYQDWTASQIMDAAREV